MISQWIALAPDFQAMVALYERLAAARNRYIQATYELEECEYRLKREYPRQPATRDELLTPYRKAVVDAKIELEEVRASVQLHEALMQRMLIELWLMTVPRAGMIREEQRDEQTTKFDNAGAIE